MALLALGREKLAEAARDLEEDLRENLRTLLGQEGEAVVEVLHEVSDDVRVSLQDLDSATASLTAPLKKLIARYRDIEERITDALEAIEKEKLAIEYARSVVKMDRAESLLELELSFPEEAPEEDDVAALYRKMLKGDFADAIRAALDGSHPEVVLLGGVFKRAFERKVTSGITVNLFGLQIATRRVLSTSLKVEHAPGGQIDIFEAEGDVVDERIGFGEGQSMRISNFINFLTAPADVRDALVVHLNYTDKNMTAMEFGQYLKSLEDAELIVSGAKQRLMAAYGELGVVENDGDRALRMDTLLTPSREALGAVASCAEEKIVRVAIEELVKSHRRIGWTSRALDLLGEACPGARVEDQIFQWRHRSRRQIIRKLPFASDRHSRLVSKVVFEIANHAEDLASFCENWRSLKSKPVPPVNAQGEIDPGFLREIHDLHALMVEDLQEWAHARSIFVGLAREDLSRFAAAFLSSIRRLSGNSSEPLVPIVSWREQEYVRRVALV